MLWSRMITLTRLKYWKLRNLKSLGSFSVGLQLRRWICRIIAVIVSAYILQ